MVFRKDGIQGKSKSALPLLIATQTGEIPVRQFFQAQGMAARTEPYPHFRVLGKFNGAEQVIETLRYLKTAQRRISQLLKKHLPGIVHEVQGLFFLD
jgi:hypothetical protein